MKAFVGGRCYFCVLRKIKIKNKNWGGGGGGGGGDPCRCPVFNINDVGVWV